MLKIIFLVFLAFSVKAFPQGQEVKKINATDLKGLLHVNDHRLHVVNFWATWCSPCVKELTGFEKAMEEYPANKVSFLFVSLDFPSSYEKTLIPFIENRKIKSKVVLMTEQDADSWIRMVNENWQGNIPATLIYNASSKKRIFHSSPLDYDELKTLIEDNL